MDREQAPSIHVTVMFKQNIVLNLYEDFFSSNPLRYNNSLRIVIHIKSSTWKDAIIIEKYKELRVTDVPMAQHEKVLKAVQDVSRTGQSQHFDR